MIFTKCFSEIKTESFLQLFRRLENSFGKTENKNQNNMGVCLLAPISKFMETCFTDSSILYAILQEATK